MSVPDASAHAAGLRAAALDLCWRQWAAIGATAAAGTPAVAMVDPEALILCSLWLAEEERRLPDLLGSWVRLNASLVSIQRLRNLAGRWPAAVRARLASLAVHATDVAKDSRWKSIAGDARGAEPLRVREGKVRAIEAPAGRWSALLLQLRRGMGVGAKADILAFVLGVNVHEPRQPQWVSGRTIADAVGYTPASVRRAAEDLAAARFLRTPDTLAGERSRQRLYAAPTTRWAALLGVSKEATGWPWWHEQFRFVAAAAEWLDGMAGRKVGGYAREVGARDLLVAHAAALQHAQLLDRGCTEGAEPGWELLLHVIEQLRARFAESG